MQRAIARREAMAAEAALLQGEIEGLLADVAPEVAGMVLASLSERYPPPFP